MKLTKERLATKQSVGEPMTGEKPTGTPTLVQQDVKGSDPVTMEGSSRVPRSPPIAIWWRSSLDHGAQTELGGRMSSCPTMRVCRRLPTPRCTTRLMMTCCTTMPRTTSTCHMHADPEHCWEIATMTVKEALASWKGKAVKIAMEEEIRSLIGMGTWEPVERPRGVNIMKNRWVLMTTYHIDDTIAREKARLVEKGFTQTYNEKHRLRRVVRANYYNDGTGQVCKLLKSLYGLKQSPLLWYKALNNVLVGAGWKKRQVDEALYFKAGSDGVAYWVLFYVDDMLAASSSTAMLKELKELLEAAFELREISPVERHLGLKIVRDWPARKL
ncbi:unnamed protein product [Closterium sp. NIES-54]